MHLFMSLSLSWLEVTVESTDVKKSVSIIRNVFAMVWTPRPWFHRLRVQMQSFMASSHSQEDVGPFSLFLHSVTQGRIQGGLGAPIFGKVNFIFYIVYNVWRNIFEIEFGFYSGRNPRNFWKCGGVSVCVWIEIVAATVFFVLQRPHFEWYPRPFWSQKYMPDCRKSHLIFQNFLGRPPAGARAFGAWFGASTPYWAPFPKFLDPPL